MAFGYLTEDDWDQFENQYRPAYNFLLERQLEGELRVLEMSEKRRPLTAHENNRLAELKAWRQETRKAA